MPERSSIEPTYSIVEKLGRDGVVEYHWRQILEPSSAAIFYRDLPPEQLDIPQAFNKYLAIDRGVESSEDIELITWQDPRSRALVLNQVGRPRWLPDIHRSGLLMGVSYVSFRSNSGLYTAFFSLNEKRIEGLTGTMDLVRELRN